MHSETLHTRLVRKSQIRNRNPRNPRKHTCVHPDPRLKLTLIADVATQYTQLMS